MSDNLSTEPYKGVRDFYPEDQFIQHYIYELMRESAEQFGYEEYDASLLEPAELYEAKSSQEIVEEQTYTFEDRGERRVTLRPEMTPTVARMVAGARKTMKLPARWFSIANIFRYERPQRGRLREHIQLNVDMFGLSSREADAEVIEVAANVLHNAGATQDDFTIYISNRTILHDLYQLYAIDETVRPALTRLLDKKAKMDQGDFREQVANLVGERADDFIETISSGENTAAMLGERNPAVQEVNALIDLLQRRGTRNVELLPTMVRGFDYYTGMVFEVFDTDPRNNRSMFGGGRYDNLLATFGAEPTPAVGFGMGDVTLYDFLERRDLVPAYRSAADIALCRLDEKFGDDIHTLANRLRNEYGLHVRTDISNKKVGDQIKDADKSAIPFVICVGNTEIEKGVYTIKHLPTGNEKAVTENQIPTAMDELAQTDQDVESNK